MSDAKRAELVRAWEEATNALDDLDKAWEEASKALIDYDEQAEERGER